MLHSLRQAPMYVRTGATHFDLMKAMPAGLQRMLLIGRFCLLMMWFYCQLTGHSTTLMAKLHGHPQALSLGHVTAVLNGMSMVVPLGLFSLLQVLLGQMTVLPYSTRQAPTYDRTSATPFGLTRVSLLGLLRTLLVSYPCLLLMLQSTGRYNLLMERLLGHP